MDIGQFIIRLREWLVAPVCEVEGHIKKVALQLNELSALRNTFYPEYKYLDIYIYIFYYSSLCYMPSQIFCSINSVEIIIHLIINNYKANKND